MSTQIIASEAKIKNRSGTVTSGSTAQALMATNKGRGGYWIQNLSAGDLYISDVGTAAATQPSMRIAAGGLYESSITGCPTNEISIFGATTGQVFSAREWSN